MLVLIILFAYFYASFSFNAVEISNNLKKNGGMILGVRPGRPTAEFISKILSKVVLIGAIFLSIISILPIIANPLVITPAVKAITGVTDAALLQSIASSFTFGGTSLLIVIGVALEFAKELEAQLTMRNYKGFLS
jgi:preprotein translocase subunit SecY